MTKVMTVSLLAGLATMGGALITLLCGRAAQGVLAWMLGLAAGAMSGVACLDLIPSAWRWGGPWHLAAGLASGLILVWLVGRWLEAGGKSNQLAKVGYLVAAGIALHDLPEGIAIAAGYAATPALGWVIAFAIGFHNIPEGMAMAAPMLLGGQGAGRILATAGLVSLVTPLGAGLGALLVGISSHFIAYLLALAGGAMLYIVLWELCPQGRREGSRLALRGGLAGLVLVLLLTLLE